jgi:hypothetical protein
MRDLPYLSCDLSCLGTQSSTVAPVKKPLRLDVIDVSKTSVKLLWWIESCSSDGQGSLSEADRYLCVRLAECEGEGEGLKGFRISALRCTFISGSKTCTQRLRPSCQWFVNVQKKVKKDENRIGEREVC